MFHARQQSTTSYPIFIFMVLSSDHLTPATGKTLTVTISKNGAAFASPAGAVTELANGWYQIAGNATDRNTLGSLLIYATAAACDASASNFVIVPFDPFDSVRLGLTALPNVAAGAASGLPLGDASGRVDLGKWIGSAPNALVSGRPDVSVGALAASVITAASIAAAALNGKGDWSTGTAPTAAAIATQVWIDLLAGSDFGTVGSVGAQLRANIPASVAGSVGSVTGHTPQTGDSFARIGAAGAGLTAVGLDMTKTVPTSNTAQTIGDALNAARADGFGKWTLVGTTLTLYAGDGTTSVRVFTLDSASAPTSRT